MAASSQKKVFKKSSKAQRNVSGKDRQNQKKSVKRTTPKELKLSEVGIKKKYLKSKNACKVTFRLPQIAAVGARYVYVVGDFNDWNMHKNPMKKLKKGDFTVTLELERGREYQFRYLIDKVRWENDWKADKYVKSPYGDSENSVVIV